MYKKSNTAGNSCSTAAGMTPGMPASAPNRSCSTSAAQSSSSLCVPASSCAARSWHTGRHSAHADNCVHAFNCGWLLGPAWLGPDTRRRLTCGSCAAPLNLQDAEMKELLQFCGQWCSQTVHGQDRPMPCLVPVCTHKQCRSAQPTSRCQALRSPHSLPLPHCMRHP